MYKTPTYQCLESIIIVESKRVQSDVLNFKGNASWFNKSGVNLQCLTKGSRSRGNDTWRNGEL